MSHYANELYREAVQMLIQHGEVSSPRGMPIRELLNVQLKLDNPQMSIVGLRGRALNYHFMVGEALWMLSGMNRADLIEPFNRNIVMALDPGMPYFQGAYGPKIIEQLGYILEVLTADPDSRQAVLTIWRERPRESKDVPCTVMMQFLLRNEKLHMHVYMRSNDVWLGLPYDLFNFTLVQQIVACELKVGLGTYTHTVGSFHLYERNIEQAQAMLNDDVEVDYMMPLVRAVPLNVMAGAYAEASLNKPGMKMRQWYLRWCLHLAASAYNDPDVMEPWRSMLQVLAHRFDPSIPTAWHSLFEVGR